MTLTKADPVSEAINRALEQFKQEFNPLESTLLPLTDERTGASYCECHVNAANLVRLATLDVPLDPDEQPEYRANREIVVNSYAYQKMQEDAKKRRSFSNIVAEYTKEFDAEHPLKIIGGQHRFEAIRKALADGIEVYHGLKVYFDLTMEQRLDVQLISNTNIAISGDLFDRMHETVKGPGLRDWCHDVGLLPPAADFADRRERGGPVSVQIARIFITNYYLGKSIDSKKFDVTDTTPKLCPTGQPDPEWDKLARQNIWEDKALRRAASEFASLVNAQRSAFIHRNVKPDFPEKAMNLAVLAAWAYVAGMLHNNETRLRRHFALSAAMGHDPLNAATLAKGRHKTDTENYRGLGYRTDAKERGRLVELFFHQAEDGKGITKAAIDVAIAKYHAKQAQLEVVKIKAKEARETA